jgi:hypothetical protein
VAKNIVKKNQHYYLFLLFIMKQTLGMLLRRRPVTGFLRIKGISFFILILSILIITGSCATQHKFRKMNAVPCPCEKTDIM